MIECYRQEKPALPFIVRHRLSHTLANFYFWILLLTFTLAKILI